VLCRRIEKTAITMQEWHRQRAVYDDRASADLADLGFAALFLNRTNRSGIIRGGVIGGKDQSGRWGLNARFNKPDLVRRIQRIGRYRSRVNLYQMDALVFANQVVAGLKPQRSFAFFDPPYIENGKDLYLNDYTIEGHQKLARLVMRLKHPWVVTYDKAAIKYDLYGGQRRVLYDLTYSAQRRYDGREVMFLANHLVLPVGWRKHRRIELSPPRSEYPLFGRMLAPP
jgi:DNA adenine methylase